MDYIRKIFGIPAPQKYNDGYYYWGPYFGEGNAQEGNNDIEIYPQPGSQHPSRHQAEEGEDDILTRELQDMERQLRELWEPFTGGDQKSFFDMVPEIFAERHQQVPALKPGPRADQALDSRAVDGETLLAIMEEDKNERSRQLAPRGSQSPASPFSHFFQVPPGTKNFSFSRSISIQTTQRPDGVWETRKTVRDGEGNEQVTVTEVSPENRSSFPMQPDLGADQFFGGQQPGQDKRGTSIFDKIFGV